MLDSPTRLAYNYIIAQGDKERRNMKRIHGRQNEPLEYVEFRATNKAGERVTFAAQRAGEYWHTYKVTRGGGICIHKPNLRTLKQAEAVARKAAATFESK